MPFKRTTSVVQLVDKWGTDYKVVHNCTSEMAQRIAMCNPRITFFFHCREPIDLPGKGHFATDDAVFFTVEPVLVPAPPCDTYEKNFFTVGYFDSRAWPFQNIAGYTFQDGKLVRPFFDIAVLFAANINGSSPDKAELSIGGYIANTLDDTDVKLLHEFGITVLLSVLGNWEPAGWSCFPDLSSAQKFAEQLATAVDKYGLDGIDIDDEYSCCTDNFRCTRTNKCPPNATSLIMVTSALRKLKPEIIISKALSDDTTYFDANWNGSTLAQQLSYGWEMSYAGGGTSRLEPYLQYGMQKRQLGLGVWNDPHGTWPDDVKPETEQVKDQGYGGMMMFGCEHPDKARDYVEKIAQVLYGPG
jgi:hypothetical protein